MQRRAFLGTLSAIVTGSLPLGCSGPLESTDKQDTSRKTEAGDMAAKDSAWTWAYFFAAGDKESVAKLCGERKKSVTLYRVDSIKAVAGEVGVDIKPGSTLVRAETAAKLTVPRDTKGLALLMQGVPQHLEYMTRAQRDKLSSRAEFPASKDTIAVVIPIRKSPEWWALAHDERIVHFQQTEGKKGHSAVGAPYVDRIHRKLYHTRYAVETRDHDFITYFEFDRKHTDDFKKLVSALRDTDKNPEWKYVDREYEIWMTKTI
jgi:hypothetical protein